jgi:hypothetical protein
VCNFTCATGFRDCDGNAINGCEVSTYPHTVARNEVNK